MSHLSERGADTDNCPGSNGIISDYEGYLPIQLGNIREKVWFSGYDNSLRNSIAAISGIPSKNQVLTINGIRVLPGHDAVEALRMTRFRESTAIILVEREDCPPPSPPFDAVHFLHKSHSTLGDFLDRLVVLQQRKTKIVLSPSVDQMVYPLSIILDEAEDIKEHTEEILGVLSNTTISDHILDKENWSTEKFESWRIKVQALAYPILKQCEIIEFGAREFVEEYYSAEKEF